MNNQRPNQVIQSTIFQSSQQPQSNNYNQPQPNNQTNNYSQPQPSAPMNNIPQNNVPVVSAPTQPKINFKLPMSRRDPLYERFEEEIAEHIEYANLELDFHKIDEAKKHLETAAYYLKNIVD